MCLTRGFALSGAVLDRREYAPAPGRIGGRDSALRAWLPAIPV